MFFKLLTHHKLKTDPKLFKRHADYVLSMFYKLLANPTFRLKFYFQFINMNDYLFTYMGMALAVTVPDHIQRQNEVWNGLLDSDTALLPFLKPWELMETINWNNKCLLVAAMELLPNSLLIQFVDGEKITTMVRDRRGNQRFFSIGKELMNKEQKDFNNRVKEIKNLIITQLRN